MTYQPAGAGQRARTARFDLGLIPDPKSWLVERLGPLARCDVSSRDDDLDAEAGEVKGAVSSVASIDECEGVSNAPNRNPAADGQASLLPHVRDVPDRPPTQEISS